MINHQYKCIFIQTPQCGSRIIVNQFYKDYWNEFPKNPNIKFMNYGVNKNYDDYQSYINIYYDYYVFACVRNPWDRFVNGWKSNDLLRKKTFDEILNNMPTYNNSFDVDSIVNSDWRSVSQTLTDCLYKNNSLIPNFLIRYENLQSDFNTVCDTIKKSRTKLNALSTYDETNFNYKDFFVTQDQKNKFVQYFQQDITNFNYSF